MAHLHHTRARRTRQRDLAQRRNQWKTGGGSVWVTGNYDPDTNLAYWGVGNGGPWMGDKRPGDNLYVASTIALDVATGAIKGHFQYNPNDSWDWDEVSPPILVDFQRNGRTFKGLIDVARDGYLWFLDRGDATTGGRIKFIEGKPYVYQNVFKSLDPETGRPDVDPAHKPGTGKQADFCPGLHGGKNWPPIAFSPKTRMIYVPANNNICGASTGLEMWSIRRARATRACRWGRADIVPGADHFGEVQAWNVDTGKQVWKHDYAKSPNWGGMLVTGGRRGVQRRDQRPQDARLRRGDRQAALGVSDQLRHPRAADVFHGRRQTVHRGACGLGRRFARRCKRT